jgi:hypothetical protein
MRAVMRSTSLTPRSASRSGSALVQQQRRWRRGAAVAAAAVARRVGQPVAQQPAAHAGAAGVEQRQQRGRCLAAQGLHQFQVAVVAGGRSSRLAGALHPQRAHMRQRLALRVLGKAQQRGGGGVGHRQVLRVEALQRGHLQLRAQLALRPGGVELPGRPRGAGAPGCLAAGRLSAGAAAGRSISAGPAAPASRPVRASPHSVRPSCPLARPSQARPQVPLRRC